MLLGDIIARFDDPAVAAEMLVSLEDLTLLAAVRAAAAQQALSVGDFAAQAVDRFTAQASDDDWVTLLGMLARAPDPGRAFLQRVLMGALKAPASVPPPVL
jgi:hypothetical protein